MTTVLVTGPIGSGKSTACRYFASKGYPGVIRSTTVIPGASASTMRSLA